MKIKQLMPMLALVVAILMLPGISRAVTERHKPLVGLKGVGVWLSFLAPESEFLDLTREQLQMDVEQRLRQAGIRVLTEKEVLETPGMPVLYVDVNISVELNPATRPPYVTYLIKVDLLEWVAFEERFKGTVTLWFAEFSWTVGPGDGRKIQGGVSHCVGKFINDYLVANPKKHPRSKRQQTQWMAVAAKMMKDGWKLFNDGQRLIIEGKEMNDRVAVQMGFQDKMAPGNKVIQDGVNTATQGAALIVRGVKTYLDNKGTPSVAVHGLKMMVDGFRIAQHGKAMMEKGVAMNNQVAQPAGAMDKFAAGNQVVQTGMQAMAGGARLFLQGQALYLKNK